MVSKHWGNGSTTEHRKRRAYVLARDNYQCQVNGPNCLGFANTVDHIIPKFMGGGDEYTNLRAACTKCNYGRRDYAIDPEPKRRW